MYMHKTETIHHTHAQYRTHTYILFRVSFIVVLCYILLLNTPYFLLFLVVALVRWRSGVPYWPHYFFFLKYLTRASSMTGARPLLGHVLRQVALGRIQVLLSSRAFTNNNTMERC